jgi:hypothetical protein
VVGDDVDDDVVGLGDGERVLARVVHDDVGAAVAHQVDVGRGAHPRHVRAEVVGELHAVVPHPAGRAVDQHPLAGRHLPDVAHGAQRRQPRERQRSGLLDRQRARRGDGVLLADGDELGHPAHVCLAHDHVADLQVGDARTDGLDDAGDVGAGDAVLRPTQPVGQAREEGLAPHHVPVRGVEADGLHAHEHLVLGRDRGLDLVEDEQVGTAVAVLGECLHDWFSSG